MTYEVIIFFSTVNCCADEAQVKRLEQMDEACTYASIEFSFGALKRSLNEDQER